MSVEISLDDLVSSIINGENLLSSASFEYYRTLNTRELWLDTVVAEEENTLDIIKKILYWNRMDQGIPKDERKPIILYLFSAGGDLDICRSIIDTIQASETPIWGVNTGRCMSAAAYIFIACHKRFMFPHSTLLFHQGSAGFDGTFDQISAWFNDYQLQVAELSEIMTRFSKFSPEEISERIQEEWYVHSEEALEKGVCDRIIESLNELLQE